MGGAAVTDRKYSGFETASGALIDSANATRWSGAIGSGVEVGFAPNWSVGVEYDHLFMARSTINLTTRTGAISRTESVKQDVDMASVRVSYRWGGPVIANY
jgi:outer membrane immunogenic protein